jgi:hypothetical protein
MSNSRLSALLHASKKKNWSLNCTVSKNSSTDRIASECSGCCSSKPGKSSAPSSRPATIVVRPWPEKKKYSASPSPPLRSSTSVIAATTVSFAGTPKPASPPSVRDARKRTWSGATRSASPNHSRNASASATAPESSSSSAR